MLNLPFRIGIVELEQFWSEFIQMYVGPSLQPSPRSEGTMLFLLMIFLVDIVSNLCKRSIKPS